MAPNHVCSDCLAIVPAADHEACDNCGFVRPHGGWLVDPLTGLILGSRYRLEGRLGAGGMASVFRASRIGALGGEVAVKILAPRFSRTVVARRFEREAQVVSRLTSPHIVRIYDYDTFNLPDSLQPLFYIAMELVKGTTLGEVLKKQGKVNFLWGIDILRQTARGLEEAHREGITHRDIKPSNMMLVQHRESTHVKLVDFGIAALSEAEGSQADKLTKTGFVSGTPDYMAPEQAVGATDVGPAADVYSLGVVAYEMFSGKRPFDGDSIMDTLMQRVTRAAPSLREAVPSPAFPPDLNRIVDKMLVTKPKGRYQDAGELLDELARFPSMQTTPDWVPPAELLQRFATIQSHPVLPTPPEDDVQFAATQISEVVTPPAIGADVTVSAIAHPVVRPPRSRWPWVAGGVLLAGGLGAGAYLLATSNDGPARGTTPAGSPDAVVIVATPDASTAATIDAGAAATIASAVGDVSVERVDVATVAPADSAEPALPDTLPVTLKHARPPLEPGFAAHTVTTGNLSVTIGVPETLPPLYRPLAWRIAIDRDGAALRISDCSVRVAALPSGQTVGSSEARGRSQDGRVALELPPLPMATRYRAEIVATLPDETVVATEVVYDAATGKVSAE